ncbi:phospholipase D-like domain-containing protein [Flavihumibacter cheonanensis]|uniref:phospholipase D-like domain-containing protein n=1 Tax=Flavihumibacter cheonanensis TaxID=1442385 RepID=UPI001EF7DB5C|nr:phospholipase D-like domain-containing protein [Flavihumibacter cheonanensis]MCG7750765.1 phospholipase D-like domain-containing protein [Flavihumibacter cheonanensis]
MKKPNPLKGYTSRNRVELVRGGKAYFENLIRLLDEATHSIHFQMYILDEDETGGEVLEHLCLAAERGVKVYMLVDGYASLHLTKKRIRAIRGRGVHFRWFEPLLRARKFYFGRRLHQKVCVVDADTALVGGVNVSNRYNDLPGQSAWLDWAVLVEGEAAEKLYQVCLELWNKAGWGKSKPIQFRLPHHRKPLPEENCLVRVRRQDWVRFRIEISNSYLHMMQDAKKEVYMLSSYFLPGRQMRKAMENAVKRGVKIYVIAAGKSDVWMAKEAERYLYRWLLKNKISLFEYQSNVLHGKISCADEKWATVGSFNINFISAYASIELNLEVLDEKFTAHVKQELLEIIQQESVPVTESEAQQKYGWAARAWQKICYTSIRLIFVLFTFYFKQRRN